MSDEKPMLKVEYDEEDDAMYVKAHYIVAYDPKDAAGVGHTRALALAYMNASKVLIETARALIADKIGVEIVKEPDSADLIEDLKQSN